jgi:large subunit ribosomal protein L25
MAAPETTSLSLRSRPAEGSRAVRRLRREGLVPGVLYGGEDAPQPFQVDGRILRNTLQHGHAILQVTLDDGAQLPVLVKDVQRHPVRGEAVHVDLLRVNMRESIQTAVQLEIVGADEAPGVVAGGILSQEAREVTIEALPGDIPDVITLDASGLELNATVMLAAISPPHGVTLVDDPETVVATITPPSSDPAEDEIETETEIVGAAGADSVEAQAQAAGDTAQQAAQRAVAES